MTAGHSTDAFPHLGQSAARQIAAACYAWSMGRALALLVAVVGAGCGGDDDNVHAAASCPIEACGGDIVGSWEIAAACILEEDCASEAGTVTGTYTFYADSYDYDWTIETHGCGYVGEHDSGGGGGYRVEGNVMYRGATTDEPIFEFCVDGEVAYLRDLDPDGGGSFTLRRAEP